MGRRNPFYKIESNIGEKLVSFGSLRHFASLIPQDDNWVFLPEKRSTVRIIYNIINENFLFFKNYSTIRIYIDD